MFGNIKLGGGVTARHIKNKLGWRWQIRNRLRPAYWLGWLAVRVAIAFSRLTGIPTLTSSLSIAVRRHNGDWENLGVVGHRMVTTAFAEFMVDQLQTETSVWGDFKFHDSGTGVTAEASADVALVTKVESGRSTGTQTESTSTAYRSVGTIAYTGTRAITEHGLFSAASSVTLLDRTLFSAVNVVNGDSIEFTYTLTVTAGG